MRTALALLCCVAMGAAALATPQTNTAKTLDIYFIDTEGGQSTLFLSPTGESLLVDTGNGGPRDLGRIVETLKAAGVKQIDHMWTTHYHGDHVGAMEELAKQFPMMHFYDHGGLAPNDRANSQAFFGMYDALSKGKRTIVKPGDKVRMAGLDVTTVASSDQYLKSNLPGGGRPNAACAGLQKKDESAYFDPDNGWSAGFVMTYGKFRAVDLGDLTWNGEMELMCPTNRIGTVDLFVVSHHGIERSNSPALVHGLEPRVAVMNNGTRKGGAADAFKVVHTSPGLEDLWQLHWSYNVGVEQNAPGIFIANIDDSETIAGVLTAPPPAARGAAPAGGRGPAAPAAGAPGAATPAPPASAPAPGAPQGQGQGPAAGVAGAPGAANAAAGPGAARQGGAGGGRAGGAAAHTPAHWIKVSAQNDGTFTVTNARNAFSKTYKPRN